VFNLVELPYSSPGWIPTAEIPHHYSFDQVYREYLSSLTDGFVLQSCSLPLRDYLIQQGCQVTAMGAEAVLDLPWRGKHSVRELARRGRRHGTVHEIELTSKYRNQLAQLIHESPSRQGVQLQHTERPKFDASVRCFIFETAEQKWLGAITLSRTAPNSVHTELLLRHRDAPVGIMEALITAIAEQLTLEGIQHLSLGAVTPLPAAESARIFAAHRHPQELWTRSQLSFRLGRALNFAFNAEGLWRFKNKFSPRWEPLYLCASPGLSWATIAGLIQASGYFDLVWSQLLGSGFISMPSRSAPFPLTGPLPQFGMGKFACEKLPFQNPSWIRRGIQAKTCGMEIRG
jgi:lysylphosphatidylglycerol synthetase-like protein (DUF2156 family)